MATIEKHVTRDMVVLDGTRTCREAAWTMRDKKIGSVAVRVDGRIAGVITSRQAARKVRRDFVRS